MRDIGAGVDGGGLQDILDLVRFPLDDLDGPAGRALVSRCRENLDRFGIIDLDGLVRPVALRRSIAEIEPQLSAARGDEVRRHGVYPDPPRLVPPGHAALAEVASMGRVIRPEAAGDGVLARIYHYAPLRSLIARVLRKPALDTVGSGGIVVTRYGAGQSSGWHFDRAEFTVTLLLQAAQFGGLLEHVRGLRSDADPNPDGVAALLAGRISGATEQLMPGTLNLYRGRNMAHRVTQVAGDKARIVVEFVWIEPA